MTDLFDQALEELQKNAKAFEKKKAALQKRFPGQCAMFHRGEFIRTYPDTNKAFTAGCEEYGEGNFSLQEIDEEPVCLGFMSFYAKELNIG